MNLQQMFLSKFPKACIFFRGFINPIVWVVNTYLFNDQVERNLGIAIVLYWDFVLLFPKQRVHTKGFLR